VIGIFKVNTKRDGGYYIDKYLQKILTDNCLANTLINLSNVNFDLNFSYTQCNYKNPFVAIFYLVKLIKLNNINVVYSNQFIALFYLIICKKFFKCNIYVVGKVDGKTIRIGVKRYLFFIYDLLWKWSQQKADYIIYETNSASILIEKSKIIYTPAVNFYNVELPVTKKEKADNLTVLFVGRYSEEKGYYKINELAQKFSKIDFVMAGSEKLYFKNINNIKEVGFKKVHQIIDLYQNTDILIVPSNDDSFPTVIREFSFFNKPILATNVGSIMEFKKLGLEIHIVEKDVDSLTEGLNNIITNYRLNNNREVFYKYFNPNSKEIQQKYLDIFTNK